MDNNQTNQQNPPAVQPQGQPLEQTMQPVVPQPISQPVAPPAALEVEQVTPPPISQPVDPTAVVNAPIQELVDQVERDLLAHIYTNLKENKITGVAAQQLAQEFLALLPFKDKKDLVDKLSSLGQKYPEARETYVNLGIPLEEQQRQDRLDQMRQHIQAGNLDQALAVAKGGK